MFPSTSSRDEVEGNIRARGKTGPEVLYIKCFVTYLDLPLNNHVAKANKDGTTSLFKIVNTFE